LLAPCARDKAFHTIRSPQEAVVFRPSKTLAF
jgi:hypothetical protein